MNEHTQPDIPDQGPYGTWPLRNHERRTHQQHRDLSLSTTDWMQQPYPRQMAMIQQPPPQQIYDPSAMSVYQNQLLYLHSQNMNADLFRTIHEFIQTYTDFCYSQEQMEGHEYYTNMFFENLGLYVAAKNPELVQLYRRRNFEILSAYHDYVYSPESQAAVYSFYSGHPATLPVTFGHHSQDETPEECIDSSIYWRQQRTLYNLSARASGPHSFSTPCDSKGRASDPEGVPLLRLSLQYANKDTESESGKLQSAYVENQKNLANAAYDGQPWVDLDLSGMRLISLPNSISRFGLLRQLFLPHNKLTSLPESIKKLTHLQVLDLSFNNLTTLPEEIGMLVNLNVLNLFGNSIKQLPASIGNLCKLSLLGIEGNPLSRHDQLLFAKKGTKGLVRHYRDKTQQDRTYTPRKWVSFLPKGKTKWSVFSKPVKNDNDSDKRFTVLSYNILCDIYTSDKTYGYTPSRALKWAYRKKLISQEIDNYDADIICMQEVSRDAFNSWDDELKDEGYDSIYKQKPHAKSASHRGQIDGCATFFRREKFKLLDKFDIDYAFLGQKYFDKDPSTWSRVTSKTHIGQVSVLEHIGTGKTILVANTHIFWNPAMSDVKVVQSALLLKQLKKIAKKFSTAKPGPNHKEANTIPIVISGDFNSMPSSGVYDLFSKGKLVDHSDMQGKEYGGFSKTHLSHKLNLTSAYNKIGELPFTNFTPNFTEVIDYIWYTDASLRVTGLLGKLDPMYVDTHVGIPSLEFPSDHIPIMAEFEFQG